MIIFLKTKFKSHEIQIQLHCKFSRKEIIFYILMQNPDMRTFLFSHVRTDHQTANEIQEK